MVELPDINTDRTEMYQTNYMGFASFTVLIWDHIITFDREVQFIWPAKKNLLIYLFFLIRYLTPLGFIVNLFAYLSPVWTPETCSRFIRYEGSMTVIGINSVALMMFIRVKALYHKRWLVLGVVAFVGLFSFIMNAFLLTRGIAVVHNPASGVRACTMIFDDNMHKLSSSSAWLPLLYDTLILGLTLNKTLPSLRNKTASYVMRRLFQDGLLYYSVIFSITFVLSIMIGAAPPGIQNITAQLELLMTVAMMSRITISLKSSVEQMETVQVYRPVLPSVFVQHSHHLDVPPNTRILNLSRAGADTPTSRFGSDGGAANRTGVASNTLTVLQPNRPTFPKQQQSESLSWENRFDIWSDKERNSGLGL